MRLGLLLLALRSRDHSRNLDKTLRLILRRSLQLEKTLSDLKSERINELLRMVSEDQSKPDNGDPMGGRAVRADYDQ